MSPQDIDEQRRQLAAAEAQATRLRQELEHAEWQAEYDEQSAEAL